MPDGLKADERAKWRKLCKENPENFGKAPSEAKNDMAVCLDAVRGNGMMLEHASYALRAHRNIVMEAVKNTADCIIFVDESLRSDWELVQLVVTSKGQLLRHATEELRADSEFVLPVIRDLWFTAEYVAGDILYDPLFWKDVIEQDHDTGWMAFSYAPVELRSNHDLTMQAINVDPMAFKFASDELRSDPEFVLEAVKVNWIALKHASAAVRRNPEVVLEALRQDFEALQYADPELLADPDFALEAAGMHGRVMAKGGLNPALQDNKEWVLKAVKKNPMVLEYLDDDIREDREVVNESYAGRLEKIESPPGKRPGKCSGLKWTVDGDSAKWAVGTTALAHEALKEELQQERLVAEEAEKDRLIEAALKKAEDPAIAKAREELEAAQKEVAKAKPKGKAKAKPKAKAKK